MRIVKATFLAVLLIGWFQSFGQSPRSLTIDTSDGGSVLTKYLVGDINKDSTLRRSWHTINDSTCPLQLVRAGVKIEQRIGTTNLEYRPIVESFVANEPIVGMEMRFVLYDVFNEHIVTLEITRVEDVSPGPFMFKKGLRDNNPTALPSLSSRASIDAYLRERDKKIADDDAKNPSRFDARSNDVERLLTVASFVSQVRTKNSTIWKYDSAAVTSEIGKLLHSTVVETTLSPKAIAH